MGWLIAYDISDAKRWRAVYRIVRGVGYRLQYSLFWADIDAAEARELAEALAAVIDARADDVRLYPLDDDATVRMMGPKPWSDGVAHAAARRFDKCWNNDP